jgi:RNA polymerase sigma factor (sigma-70 family)
MADSVTATTIEAVFRVESARLIGALTRMVRDLGLAEDLAQEALVAALEHWPASGIPDNPGAWLVTTAKRRAIDELRRRQRHAREHEAIARSTAGDASDEAASVELERVLERALDEDVGDDLLRLIFIACHPVLSREARVALTLRLVGGLTTEEIARAFLAPEATIAQRIVRAKRTLAEARVPFEVPQGAARAERLPSVLEVVYLLFNEGYAATRGETLMRAELCDDALRLGRILAARLPDEPEVHGLLALMELSASRARARRGPDGAPVLLLDQDRSRWDQLLIGRGLAALARAEALARPLGPYALQGAIAACHARARTAAETDWARIVAIYDALVETTGSPVVELNRAVAVAMAFGPAEGLALVDELREEPVLEGYHLLPATRGDLLLRLGRRAEARREFERAAALAQNQEERALLLRRAASCVGA